MEIQPVGEEGTDSLEAGHPPCKICSWVKVRSGSQSVAAIDVHGEIDIG